MTTLEDVRPLVESAQKYLRRKRIIHWLEVAGVWIGMFAVSGAIWYGVLWAIGAL